MIRCIFPGAPALFLLIPFILTLAKATPDLNGLTRRASYGGYALASDTCPPGLGSCTNSPGKCCPQDLPFCVVVASSSGTACCPDANNCRASVLNGPVCADSSWVLYQGKGKNKYFCCQANQIGVLPNPGQARVGFCVGSDVPVAATKSATRVAQVSATSAPTTSGGSSGSIQTGSQSSTGSSTGLSTGSSTGSTIESTSTTAGTTSATGSSVSASSTGKSAASSMMPVETIFIGIMCSIASLVMMVVL